MENRPLTEAEQLAQPPIKELIELEAIVNFSEMKPDSVIAFRIHEVTEGLLAALAQLSRRYSEQMRKKNISVIVLAKDDKIEELDSIQMKKAGWERSKSNENRIITLS